MKVFSGLQLEKGADYASMQNSVWTCTPSLSNNFEN